MIEAIVYTAEPDNCREVFDWLEERGLGYGCPDCHGYGEYDTEYGPRGCMLCCSRLVPIADGQGGYVAADWGDEICYDTETKACWVIHPAEVS